MSRAESHGNARLSDAGAVEAVARDYIEGWYAADVGRMGRSLHDDLVKRTPVTSDDGSGAVELRPVSKVRMVELTREGGGADVDDPAIEIAVDDVSGDNASARVICADYVDYLHLVRTATGWTIVNILFRGRN